MRLRRAQLSPPLLMVSPQAVTAPRGLCPDPPDQHGRLGTLTEATVD
jgi:hypothetical protein